MFKRLAIILVLCCGIMAGAVGALRLEPVQRALFDWLQSTPALESIRLHTLQGDLIHDLTLEKLELLDSQGCWLTLEESRVTLSWSDLLQGVIRLPTVQIERVRLHRLPQYDNPERPAAPEERSSPAAAFAMRILLDQARIRQWIVDPALLERLPSDWQPRLASLSLESAATLDPGTERLSLETLLIQGDGFKISGQLNLELGNARLQGRLLAEIADIAPFVAPWSTPPPEGSVRIQADVHGLLSSPGIQVTLDSPRLSRAGQSVRDVTLSASLPGLDWGSDRAIPLSVKLSAAQPEGLPEGWQTVLNGPWSSAVQGVLQRDRGVTVRSWQMSGPSIAWQGSGELRWSDRQILGEVSGRIPELARWSTLATRPIAGGATFTGQIAGSWDDPRLVWRIEGEDLLVDAQPIAKVVLNSALNDPLHHPHGTLDLTVVHPSDTPLNLNTRYRLETPHRVRLDDLRLSAPGTRLGGSLTGEWQPLRITGRLKGEIEELRRYRSWLHPELSGHLLVDLLLEPGRDLLPQGRLQLSGKELRGPFGHLATFQGEARGSLERLFLTAQGTGTFHWPHTFVTRATLTRADQGVALEVQELSGKIAQEPLQLLKPLSVRMDPNRLEVKPWEATLGSIRARGGWSQTGKRVDGFIQGQGELTLFNRLFSWPVQGKG
ncbi:MAG: hypothetical protein HQL86_07380, partial [Magnetococcales bacterium]|nr:hypothetical protein [Magnetococcales bacterium]